MATFADADAAVDHLVELEARGRLPFVFYQVGPRDGTVDVAVPAYEQQAALDYFASHPLLGSGASAFRVQVRVVAGDSWSSEPIDGTRPHPDPASLEGLVGLDVNDAALRANAGGWVVRAHEPEAILTAEMRADRANLRFSDEGRVLSVRVG